MGKEGLLVHKDPFRKCEERQKHETRLSKRNKVTMNCRNPNVAGAGVQNPWKNARMHFSRLRDATRRSRAYNEPKTINVSRLRPDKKWSAILGNRHFCFVLRCFFFLQGPPTRLKIICIVSTFANPHKSATSALPKKACGSAQKGQNTFIIPV